MRRVAALAVFVAAPALAVPLQCHKNPRTDAMMCAAPSEVREREGIRSAPLYMGGPQNMRRTSYTVHTNCKTGVTHLKDRDGVSFAGGYNHETAAVRQLQSIICEAPLRPGKK